MNHKNPRKLMLIGLISTLFIFPSCRKADNKVADISVSNQEEQIKEVPLELYINQETKAGVYETTNGLYTGAYVEESKDIEGKIEKYEEILGENQTFRVFEYNHNKNIPEIEFIRCIADKKTPYIKIVLGKDYDLTAVYNLIYDLKYSYGITVFIELFPLSNISYGVAEYKAAYSRAYELIHKYVNNAIIVWSTNEDKVSDMPLYYPGDNYVDWAGINIYIPRYKDGQKYVYSGLDNMDFWYKTFQHHKPMIISGLAISHFSRVDHAYTIYETKEKLNLFYTQVIDNYPRIKGILYMDINMNEISESNKEDYRITSQVQLIEYMKELNKPLKYLHCLEENKNNVIIYPMKYSVVGTYFGDKLYISEEYVNACFNKINLRAISRRQDMTGEVFYDMEELKEQTNCFYK